MRGLLIAALLMLATAALASDKGICVVSSLPWSDGDPCTRATPCGAWLDENTGELVRCDPDDTPDKARNVFVPGSGSKENYTQTFTGQVAITLTHNLGTDNLIVQCYDSDDVEIGVDHIDIDAADPWDVVVTLAASANGRCVVNGLSSIVQVAGAANYSEAFAAVTTVTLDHNLGTDNLLVQCYDSTDVMIGSHQVDIDAGDPWDIVVTFQEAETGRCVVNGLMNAGRYTETFAAQTSVTVLGATHGLGTNMISVNCYDDSDPREFVEPDKITTDDGTNDVVITFLESETGKCVLQ